MLRYYSSDVIALYECKVAMDIAVGDLLLPRNQLNLYRVIVSRRHRMLADEISQVDIYSLDIVIEING